MNSVSIDQWLADLAARQPTPGGGGAAALAAATSAALVSMVAKYTAGPKFAEVEAQAAEIDAEAEALRATAIGLIEGDAEAFAAVGEAYGLPKEDEGRKARIQAALAGAAEPPRRVAQVASSVVELASRLEPIGNRNVLSDVGVAASLAGSAIESAIVNIEVNRQLIEDPATRDALTADVEAVQASRERARELVDSVRRSITAS
ncbi:MAG TPA: cyclodeaminase/cyclohydrolase family protein [Solirubrobacter sp.]